MRPAGKGCLFLCAGTDSLSHTLSLSLSHTHTHRPRAVIATFLPFGLLCSLVIIVAAVLSPA
jgi:hypothetical protein